MGLRDARVKARVHSQDASESGMTKNRIVFLFLFLFLFVNCSDTTKSKIHTTNITLVNCQNDLLSYDIANNNILFKFDPEIHQNIEVPPQYYIYLSQILIDSFNILSGRFYSPEYPYNKKYVDSMSNYVYNHLLNDNQKKSIPKYVDELMKRYHQSDGDVCLTCEIYEKPLKYKSGKKKLQSELEIISNDTLLERLGGRTFIFFKSSVDTNGTLKDLVLLKGYNEEINSIAWSKVKKLGSFEPAKRAVHSKSDSNIVITNYEPVECSLILRLDVLNKNFINKNKDCFIQDIELE